MKFSSRLPGELEDNALARAVAARRAGGKIIFDLTLANPTLAGLEYPAAEIGAALAEGAKEPYRPEPRGLLAARNAVAEYYRGRGPDAVDPAHLHLTASTSEAYGLLFKLLGEPGAEILAPAPSYPLIEHLAALDGWRARPYPLVLNGAAWEIDRAALAKAVTPATRALAIIHPHNPTGWLMRGGEVAHFLLEFCEAHTLALIADEVFLDYSAAGFERFACSFAAHQVSAPVFTLGGLSKSCGMPQLKLGWIHAGGPAAQRAEAQARLDFIADAYLSVSTPVQAAAPRLLEIGAGVRAQIRRRIDENCAFLLAQKWPAGFSVVPREAGWTALLHRPAAVDEEKLALQLLDRAGVLAHPGYFFDFPEAGWHVLSLLPEPAVFRTGVSALCEWLPKLV